MGPISLAADGRGLSIRDRIVLAAAETVKAAGIDVQDTNISVGSAYYHAKKSRVEVSERVQEEFQCPDHRLQTSGGDWVHPQVQPMLCCCLRLQPRKSGGNPRISGDLGQKRKN